MGEGHALLGDLVGEEDAGAAADADHGDAVAGGLRLTGENGQHVDHDLRVLGELLDQIEAGLLTAGPEGLVAAGQRCGMGQRGFGATAAAAFDDEDRFSARDLAADLHQLETIGHPLEVDGDDLDARILAHMGEQLRHADAGGVADGHPLAEVLVIGAEHLEQLEADAAALRNDPDAVGPGRRDRALLGDIVGVEAGEGIDHPHAVGPDEGDLVLFGDGDQLLLEVGPAHLGETVAEDDRPPATEFAELAEDGHGTFRIDSEDADFRNFRQIAQRTVARPSMDARQVGVHRVEAPDPHTVLENDPALGAGSRGADHRHRPGVEDGRQAGLLPFFESLAFRLGHGSVADQPGVDDGAAFFMDDDRVEVEFADLPVLGHQPGNADRQVDDRLAVVALAPEAGQHPPGAGLGEHSLDIAAAENANAHGGVFEELHQDAAHADHGHRPEAGVLLCPEKQLEAFAGHLLQQRANPLLP